MMCNFSLISWLGHGQESTGSLNFYQWTAKAANNDTEVEFKYGYKITITKSEYWMTYPITYVQVR